MPHAIALSQNGATLSYGELEVRATSLAGHLRSIGVAPAVTVALSLPRSFDYIISALAVWKAGGAYLPMDPGWPPERRDFVIKDSGALALITRSATSAPAPYLIDLDHDPGVHLERPLPAPQPSTQRDQLAYIIYTSGSTGEPNGVEVTHGNLLNLIFWHRRAFGVGAADRATHLSGLAFDAAVWEIWPYLTVGAEVALVDEQARTSPELLRDWIVDHRIHVAFVPTALGEPMLGLPWPSRTDLRYLLIGAEALHRYPPAALPFTLVNNYGPTECTVVATSGVVPSRDAAEPPSIGQAIANMRVYLLDENRQPVAPGDTGEIYLGGTSVARGYRNRPELTARRFVANPSGPDTRLYRTGDLAVQLTDGQFAFRGRVDNQVKIRGHRVEPDEVAAVLSRYPTLRSCTVVPRGGDADRHLVAYVVSNGGAASTPELRDFLADRLPDYMLPSLFVAIETIPLTANGKVDRSALPEPGPNNTLALASFRAPRSPVEIRVAGILSELLKADQIGLDDNFFLLGGHSLLGTQLVLRARETFDVELTLRHVFEAQTVGKLAAEIERLLIARLEGITEEHAARLLAQSDRP